MAGPGRSHREGISLFELAQRFPDEESAVQWFERLRWPNGVCCPKCGATEHIGRPKNEKPMRYRCRACREYFSVRTGTVMERSKISLQKWVWAIHIYSTSVKGVASTTLSTNLKITQKSAWFLGHRIREAMAARPGPRLEGPVEVDEAYLGGKAKNWPLSRRRWVGGGTSHMTPVVGIRDRTTREVRAQAISHVTRSALQGFVYQHARHDALVFTDENRLYKGLPNHETVEHSVGLYVDGQAHVNGMESFWSLLKRAYHGTYHHFSPKHMQRYVDEMATRQNLREMDTADLMGEIAARMVGKRLTYEDLTSGGPAYPKAEVRESVIQYGPHDQVSEYPRT